ncbi:lytic polysaccharide monooxygenase [Salinactinospora qingdaonensis]|uniref:Lytic polysaccharide monooxygenase n=1 Tax=Salinactinospora qingdaonensis TaxID=702744 RepID=A0ABP7GCV5_9ACTN
MKLARRLAFLGGLAGLAGAFAVALPADDAAAHGGLTFPETRTYACYRDAIDNGNGGALNPTNPACIDALEQGGQYAFYNWFGNLLPDSGSAHREVIPDGELCGPGDDFQAFNMARTDWPTTELQANSTITMRYNAWAAHPGTWFQYVTKDGWDPNQPLGWDDLEPEPFNEVTNPPIDGQGPEGDEYTWEAQLPDKSGRHIIYSIWQRSDSPESFYNCADVMFTGGGDGGDDTQAPTAPGAPSASNVGSSSVDLSWGAASDDTGVTGYDVYDAATGEVVASSSGTSTTVTGLSAETDYTFYVVASDAAGNTSAASSEVSVTTQSGGTDPDPSGTCEVDFSIANSWSNGYTANVTINNTGDSAIGGWDLEWDVANGETVNNAWSANLTQDGDHITAANASWNSTIGAGGSVSFGFNADGSAAEEPDSFTLNGSACSVS